MYYRITLIKCPGRLFNFPFFLGGGGAFNRGGVYFEKFEKGGGAFKRSNK